MELHLVPDGSLAGMHAPSESLIEVSWEDTTPQTHSFFKTTMRIPAVSHWKAHCVWVHSVCQSARKPS